MIKLILFGTSGCHLCEEAEEIINSVSDKIAINVESIDIAIQEQWQQQYAIRIPVLYYPETKSELGWPFTQDQVQTFINELSHD